MFVFYLEKLGVELKVSVQLSSKFVAVKHDFNRTLSTSPSEDPIEAMSLIAAGVITKSANHRIKRVPIEFTELELAILSQMGLKYSKTDEYKACS
jgi:UDP-N-acetylglucosamine 1-carboxyvinyltransferase